MKKYRVSFSDYFEAETEEECYDELLKYLKQCVDMRDVTAFEFEGDTISTALDSFVDNLRKSNDMWRLSQDEVAEMILKKYNELKNEKML